MKSKHKSLAVSQYILDLVAKSNTPYITPMKLLKLVYIAHGYMLGKHGTPLLTEDVYAFEYGPFVKSVYEAIRHYRSQDIVHVKLTHNIILNDQEKEVIEDVVNTYAKFDVVLIAAAILQEDSPWSMARSLSEDNPIISNDLIKHFYNYILKQKTHSSL